MFHIICDYVDLVHRTELNVNFLSVGPIQTDPSCSYQMQVCRLSSSHRAKCQLLSLCPIQVGIRHNSMKNRFGRVVIVYSIYDIIYNHIPIQTFEV